MTGLSKGGAENKGTAKRSKVGDGKSTAKKNMTTKDIKETVKITNLVTLEGCKLVGKNEKPRASDGKSMYELKFTCPVRGQKNDAGKMLSEAIEAGNILMVTVAKKQPELGVTDPPDKKKKQKAQKTLALKTDKTN